MVKMHTSYISCTSTEIKLCYVCSYYFAVYVLMLFTIVSIMSFLYYSTVGVQELHNTQRSEHSQCCSI